QLLSGIRDNQASWQTRLLPAIAETQVYPLYRRPHAQPPKVHVGTGYSGVREVAETTGVSGLLNSTRWRDPSMARQSGDAKFKLIVVPWEPNTVLSRGMFESYLSRWKLSPDGAPITTPAAHLLPVLKNGKPAMLKLSHDADE